jgi:hypothetical protein
LVDENTRLFSAVDPAQLGAHYYVVARIFAAFRLVHAPRILPSGCRLKLAFLFCDELARRVLWLCVDAGQKSSTSAFAEQPKSLLQILFFC